jgi:hypothetical protein
MTPDIDRISASLGADPQRTRAGDLGRVQRLETSIAFTEQLGLKPVEHFLCRAPVF